MIGRSIVLQIAEKNYLNAADELMHFRDACHIKDDLKTAKDLLVCCSLQLHLDTEQRKAPADSSTDFAYIVNHFY